MTERMKQNGVTTAWIAAFVGVLTLLITSTATYMKAEQAARHAERNTTQTEQYRKGVEEYRHEVNSKLDTFMELIRTEAYRLGKEDAVEAQAVKDAVTDAVKDAVKDAAEIKIDDQK